MSSMVGRTPNAKSSLERREARLLLDFIRESADSFQYVPSNSACGGDFRISQPHRVKQVRAILLSLAGGLVLLVKGLAGVYTPKIADIASALLVAEGLKSGTRTLAGAHEV